MKKKRRLKSWVWVLIGFILGILYSYLFVCQDLIKSMERAETMALVQTYQEEENEPQKQNKVEITKEYECTLDEVSCKIKKVAQDYGVDWRLAIAISMHETGKYTSVAFNDNNNVGGNFRNGSLMVFEDLDKGIDFFISNSQDDFCSIEKSLERIEKDGSGSGNGISEKTLLSAIEIVSKQK